MQAVTELQSGAIIVMSSVLLSVYTQVPVYKTQSFPECKRPLTFDLHIHGDKGRGHTRDRSCRCDRGVRWGHVTTDASCVTWLRM